MYEYLISTAHHYQDQCYLLGLSQNEPHGPMAAQTHNAKPQVQSIKHVLKSRMATNLPKTQPSNGRIRYGSDLDQTWDILLSTTIAVPRPTSQARQFQPPQRVVQLTRVQLETWGKQQLDGLDMHMAWPHLATFLTVVHCIVFGWIYQMQTVGRNAPADFLGNLIQRMWLQQVSAMTWTVLSSSRPWSFVVICDCWRLVLMRPVKVGIDPLDSPTLWRIPPLCPSNHSNILRSQLNILFGPKSMKHRETWICETSGETWRNISKNQGLLSQYHIPASSWSRSCRLSFDTCFSFHRAPSKNLCRKTLKPSPHQWLSPLEASRPVCCYRSGMQTKAWKYLETSPWNVTWNPKKYGSLEDDCPMNHANFGVCDFLRFCNLF